MDKKARQPRDIKRINILQDGWPEYGLLRCDQIIAPGGTVPVSKSQFWILVKQYNIPIVKLSPKVTAFWVQDLRRAFFGAAYVCPSDPPSVGADDVALTPVPTSHGVCNETFSSNPAISKASDHSGGRRTVFTKTTGDIE